MNDEQRFTFAKNERVTGKRRIDALFAHGHSFLAFPFRVIYLEREVHSMVPVSILISVPKKKIRSAVQRNRIKRLAREAYRLNRHLLDSLSLCGNCGMDIAFIFVQDEITDYAAVEKGMRKAMRKLISQHYKGEEMR